MRFKKLLAQNFLSFKKLEYEFQEAGLYFIGGEHLDSKISSSNGAGKSAFTEALCWGLYGKTVRAIGRDDVVNWKVGKDCVVEVEFEDDFGETYRVVRYRKHSKNGNNLAFFKGKESLTYSDSRKTQEEIDRILGLSWLVFSSAIVFGEKARRFAQATDKEKKEIFDELLMFHKYIEAQEQAKQDKKELQSKIEATLFELESWKGKIELATTQLSEAEETYNRLKEEQEKTTSQIQEIESEIETFQRTLDEKREELEQRNKELEELKGEDTKLSKHLRELEEQKRVSLSAILKEKEQLYAEYVATKSRYEEKSALLEKGKCPTCGQEVSAEGLNLDALSEKVKTLHQQYSSKEKECLQIEEEWNEKIKKTYSVREELDLSLIHI